MRPIASEVMMQIASEVGAAGAVPAWGGPVAKHYLSGGPGTVADTVTRVKWLARRCIVNYIVIVITVT